MSVTSHRSGSPQGAAVGMRARRSVLLRRLMIRCPISGRATDTGFELTSIPAVSRSPQLLVDCLACGQDHPWEIGDAFIEEPG
jgi:hypothetical protein